MCMCVAVQKFGVVVYMIFAVANMASYAISSSLTLVIHDNMIIGTNHIVSACPCRHF
jgi:hypothetical protein